jgi:hypothetical protein
MNKLEYYHRQKEACEDRELNDIKTEYELKGMTISQIGDIHHRTPGSISYKLKNLGIISDNKLARGYLEYKESSLYKEIVETGKTKNTEEKSMKVAKVKKEPAPFISPFGELVKIGTKTSRPTKSPTMNHQIRMPPDFTTSTTYARNTQVPWTERQRIPLRETSPPSSETTDKTTMTFGKYNGKSYEFIRQNDVAYCNWSLKQMNVGGRMLEFQLWLKKNTRKVACECCNGSGLVDVI